MFNTVTSYTVATIPTRRGAHDRTNHSHPPANEKMPSAVEHQAALLLDGGAFPWPFGRETQLVTIGAVRSLLSYSTSQSSNATRAYSGYLDELVIRYPIIR
jgi:hypothetical protein